MAQRVMTQQVMTQQVMAQQVMPSQSLRCSLLHVLAEDSLARYNLVVFCLA